MSVETLVSSNSPVRDSTPSPQLSPWTGDLGDLLPTPGGENFQTEIVETDAEGPLLRGESRPTYMDGTVRGESREVSRSKWTKDLSSAPETLDPLLSLRTSKDPPRGTRKGFQDPPVGTTESEDVDGTDMRLS